MSKDIKYLPKKKSIRTHQVPDWFHDAKLGIFITWGIYSVPAYAPTGINIRELIKKEGITGQIKNNAYAEWYLNTLRIKGSSAYNYHKETYGEDFNYEDFIPIFNKELEKWNPDEMTEIIKKSRAKYVVLVTKFHDGFLLWPSQHKHPIKGAYHTNRDVVGELNESIKNKGMKMGFYYSGTFDWSFNPNPITDAASFVNNGVMTPEYIEYANNHWYELIDKYNPMILWNDIGYPPGTNVFEIMAYFYNKNPEGVINNRWSHFSKLLRKFISFKPINKIVNWIIKRIMSKEDSKKKKKPKEIPQPKYGDFSTPEYAQFHEIRKEKWESIRGIGNSFGYNKFETAEDYLSVEELVHSFVDIVSKNGNLLLNVGPKADGSIPDIQKEILLGFGAWLEINGDAIFGTRPWIRAETETNDGTGVRFTKKDDSLYVIILGCPTNTSIKIKNLRLNDNSEISTIMNGTKLNWTQNNDRIDIELDNLPKETPAITFKITPIPS